MRTQKLTAKDLPVSLDEFRLKALSWANGFRLVSYYNPNGITYPHNGFEHFLAISDGEPISFPDEGHFEKLRQQVQLQAGYLCGYLSYDLKNQIEKLNSHNQDKLGFPEALFFRPQVIINFHESGITITSNWENSSAIVSSILSADIPTASKPAGIKVQQRVSKAAYTTAVETIKDRIVEGDVYEMNYCMEFFAEQAGIDALPLYLALVQESPTPFSGYLKFNGNYLLCASPERFLKKEGSKIISQPTKGTIRRGSTPEEDERLKLQLRQDEKELAENMMIVDLVRNDLSRSCTTGSVTVEEMFGIYGFRQVWQMISTVSGTLKPENELIDAIKGAFPMGSMTGAPKISAMKIIEELEVTKRGLYSGTFGYITPGGDCDFNVVIRSIQYNSNTGYLSFMVGSAITYDSDPEREYEECLLKAQAMLRVLS